MKLLIVLALVAGTYAGTYAQSDGRKSINVPQPRLVEMPSQQVRYSAPALARYGTTSQQTINVALPTINVPDRLEKEVNIPHTPIKIPTGGIEHKDIEYNIPQPVITIPKPIIQRKPVIYNVPQPIIQVPEPIIRHHPVYYKVPHTLHLNSPIFNQRVEQYNVPSAALHQKSGYGSVGSYVATGLTGVNYDVSYSSGYGSKG